MTRASVLLAYAFVLMTLSLAAAEPDSPIFGLVDKHDVHVTLSAADYAAMEPPQRAGGGFGARPQAGPGRPAPGSPDAGAGNFGFEFDYVKGDVSVDGAPFKNIGVRYKGNGTYMMSARQTKRSLKIDFDRYDDDLKWHDEKKINLNSGAMDPTKAREILAYSVFRAAGVPAPRTGLAEVTLTIPGKFDAEHLGVFTLVEQVDKSFLKTHFKSSKGLLLKPEGIRGVPYLGDDGPAYDASYRARTDAQPGQWERLVAFTKLINKADDAAFRREIGDMLDVPAFAKFLAANAMLASMDGFIGMGHNYYLYLDAETNKFTFFPWDLDLAFGAFPMYGTAQQLLDLSIDHPHVGENKLIDRLLAMPEFKAAYRKELRKLVDEDFTPERLGARIRTVEEALQPLLVKDKAAADARKEGGGGFGGGGPGGMFGGAAISLTTFLEKRKASVDAQLAGTSKGYTPTQQGFGFGGGGPPGGGGGAGGFGGPNVNAAAQLAKPLFDAIDADKNGQVSKEEWETGMRTLSQSWDQDRNESLTQKELTDGLQKLLTRPRPPGRQ